MTTSVTDSVLNEIEDLRRQIRAAQERIAFLMRLRDRPTVVPLLHYNRHHREYHEPAMLFELDERSALEQAYRELEGMSDAGACYARGIEVGGVYYPIDELWGRFGDLD